MRRTCDDDPMLGRLIVAATPIGNPHDASPRLVRALATADVVAAEDTRRIRRLADSLDVRPHGTVLSLFEGNEARRTEEVLARLRSGATVLLVSDAGTPTISDPGQRLVRRCLEQGIPVTGIPGPSAAATAVAVSGLVSGRFCFEGFLPRRSGERRRRLTELSRDPRPTVFFESPRRLGGTLADLADVWGERDAVVCRELTKTHEEIVRGDLRQLAAWAEGGVLGEVTVVVAGAPAAPAVAPAELRGRVEQLTSNGLSRRDAVQRVAEMTGTPRREVYRAAVGAAPPQTLGPPPARTAGGEGADGADGNSVGPNEGPP